MCECVWKTVPQETLSGLEFFSTITIFFKKEYFFLGLYWAGTWVQIPPDLYCWAFTMTTVYSCYLFKQLFIYVRTFPFVPQLLCFLRRSSEKPCWRSFGNPSSISTGSHSSYASTFPKHLTSKSFCKGAHTSTLYPFMCSTVSVL